MHHRKPNRNIRRQKSTYCQYRRISSRRTRHYLGSSLQAPSGNHPRHTSHWGHTSSQDHSMACRCQSTPRECTTHTRLRRPSCSRRHPHSGQKNTRSPSRTGFRRDLRKPGRNCRWTSAGSSRADWSRARRGRTYPHSPRDYRSRIVLHNRSRSTAHRDRHRSSTASRCHIRRRARRRERIFRGHSGNRRYNHRHFHTDETWRRIPRDGHRQTPLRIVPGSPRTTSVCTDHLGRISRRGPYSRPRSRTRARRRARSRTGCRSDKTRHRPPCRPLGRRR